MMLPFKILLVDDQPLIRSALRLMIEAHESGRYIVIGECPDGQSAIRTALDTEADIILLDLLLPGRSGLDVIKELKVRRPAARIIALTTSDNEEMIRKCLVAGVSGYVQKRAEKDELFQAIEAIMMGETFICAASRARVVDVKSVTKKTRKFVRKSDLLSDRETQVLHLIVEGCRNKDMADALFLSVKTIEKHRANIRKKLGVKTTAELITYYHQQKMYGVT